MNMGIAVATRLDATCCFVTRSLRLSKTVVSHYWSIKCEKFETTETFNSVTVTEKSLNLEIEKIGADKDLVPNHSNH
jgi:hypothetical protein